MSLTHERVASDPDLEVLLTMCKSYEAANVGSEAKAHRLKFGSFSFRVIDPAFSTMDFPERYRKTWHFLTQLPPAIQGQISAFVLQTPDEATSSAVDADLESSDRFRS